MGGSGVEGSDCVDDGLLLIGAKLGVDGKSEDLGGSSFADGEVAGAVSEVGECCLLMQRKGVIDLAADAAVCEVLPELVAARCADDVLVKDVGRAWVGKGKDDLLRVSGE